MNISSHFCSWKKEWNPSPINSIMKKNVKPARSTLALVSHSFLLAWLNKWSEGQVKILSRNWRGTVTFTLASYLDPSMQSHVLCKDFTLGPASLWWIDIKGPSRSQPRICLAQGLPMMTQRCLLGALLPRVKQWWEVLADSWHTVLCGAMTHKKLT